ncbi:MAG: tRNA uridine-5-carboxymethylaminomethyl(34) synthesis GTPase MnmE [Terriglobales bacterium]
MPGPAASEDTIVAIATPAGRGGLGVVRLSGAQAQPFARAMLRAPGGGPPPELAPRRLRRLFFVPLPPARSPGPDTPVTDGVWDEVLVAYFRAPHSYTAEDVVEISGHGSPVLLAAMVQAAVAAGARLATPGEFTRRAWLNGRLDLAQAEAVQDLIAAETLWQARSAARQMQGSVARQLRPLRDGLVELIARLEAGIDFADDDVPVAPDTLIAGAVAVLERQTAEALAGFRQGQVLRHGLSLAILGRPNVGKSSLFNRLLARDRAIVTAAPGTTRDAIAEPLDLDGLPLRLVDTAGLREGESEAEQLGIERSWQAAADAEIVLVVFDRSLPLQPDDDRLLARLANWPQCVPVLNKSDLSPPQLTPDQLQTAWRAAGAAAAIGHGIAEVSARTGGGIDALRSELRRRWLPDLDGNSDFLTNARHAACIAACQEALRRAAEALRAGLPHEVLLVELHAGLRELDAITGPTTAEDILGVIFSRFCVGK